VKLVSDFNCYNVKHSAVLRASGNRTRKSHVLVWNERSAKDLTSIYIHFK
jgi:hypothetical protein